MPRSLVRAPRHDRSRSLGWLVLAWLEHWTVHGPGDVQGEPVVHGDEMSGFLADCYALDDAGRRLYDSAFLSRPKGADKSGQAARLALAEALGPVRFAGWAQGGELYAWYGFRYRYAAGEPMGRPVSVPYVRCLATEEQQVGNVYDAVHFNLLDGPLSEVPGVDCGLTRTLLPGGGEITPSTAASSSKDGGKETFCIFDESHLYNSSELRQMYKTVTRNLVKRRAVAEPWYLETTTMFMPGQNSIAESTYELAEAIREGRARRSRALFDHRWGECGDLTNEPALRAAIHDAYGDAMGWIDDSAIVDEFYDPRADVIDSRRYFLNARTSASDAWIDSVEWAQCADPTSTLNDGDTITLGFDGAVRSDSTALCAVRVTDGHLFLLGCWEKPVSQRENWEVDREAVDATVAAAFDRYDVVGFFADPPHWQDTVDRWAREFGDRLQVKASAARPMEFWTNRPKVMVDVLSRFHDAVVEHRVIHDGDSVLTRHILNARRRLGRSGITIAKEHPQSDRKIDAAIAAALAYEARADAVATGVRTEKRRTRRMYRY